MISDYRSVQGHGFLFFSHFRRPPCSELPTTWTSNGGSSGVRGGGSELQRVKLIFDQCYVVIIIIIIII